MRPNLFPQMSISKMCFNKISLRWLFLKGLAALAVSLVAACGGGGDTSPAPAPLPLAASNVMRVTVDSGPSGNQVNRLYASVTICAPGSTTQCQTIDHILVDTGSTGLRLLSSVISPALGLSRVTGTTGLPLLNCAQFVDNTFAWGPVAVADVLLGGKSASSVPIQIISDPAFIGLAAVCSSGDVITSPANLGANGILGLGLFKEDCGSRCAATAVNGFYYSCGTASCTTAVRSVASLARQLKNPVALFAADNNGMLIDLPAVNVAGTSSLTGSLVFGIGTQSNNQPASASVLTTNGGNITTLFAGKSLDTSFIDTGSNGLYFDSSTIPACAGAASGFYCPASLTNLSATMVGANGVSMPVAFSINNALTSFSSGNLAVIPTLSGSIGDARTFDWGLPFFYGRRVFSGIEGQSSSLGTGPFYAF